jgi:phage FluMu gp28-like protein
VGVDLGQKRDHSVVAVIEKSEIQYELVHLKQFALGTEYTQVLDYLALVAERFQTVRAYYIDRTGLGEVFDEFARKKGLKNVKGKVLTMQEKQEVMTCLKQVMLEKRLHLPRDRELENEMNAEISEQTMTGKTKFYHRSGTHDDRLWALALALYAGRHDIVRYHPVGATGAPSFLQDQPWRRMGVLSLRELGRGPLARQTGGVAWCYACNHAKLTGAPHTCPGQLPR